MANRNALLGRSRPREKLTREEIAALDKATVPPAPATTPAEAAREQGRRPAADGPQGPAEVSLEPRVPWLRLQGHRRMASPSPGNVWRGAAAAKWSWSWAAGDAAGNPEYVNQEALMIEPEVLKELRIIVAKVAHADQASGRAPAHVLQAKEKVREELVSAVREKYEAYLATAN